MTCVIYAYYSFDQFISEGGKTVNSEIFSLQRKDFLQLMMNAHKEEVHEEENDLHGADDDDLHSLIDEHHGTTFQESKNIPKTKLTLNELFAQVKMYSLSFSLFSSSSDSLNYRQYP